MNKSKKFSPGVRERAVRLVRERRGEYPSLWVDTYRATHGVEPICEVLHVGTRHDAGTPLG